MNLLKHRFSLLGTGIKLQSNVTCTSDFKDCVTMLSRDLSEDVVNEAYIANNSIHIRHLEYLGVDVDGLHAIDVSVSALSKLAGDASDPAAFCSVLSRLKYTKQHWANPRQLWSATEIKERCGIDCYTFVASHFKFEELNSENDNGPVKNSMAHAEKNSASQMRPRVEYGL